MSTQIPKKETWSRADEYLLEKLTKRKERVCKARMMPLLAFVGAMPFVPLSGVEFFADYLANNAETLRDLLEPFDSGVRQQGASHEHG